MRKETLPTPASMTIAEFRRTFPLGSTSRVVLADAQDAFAGIVVVPTAFAEVPDLAAEIVTLAIARDVVLTPEMDITAVMAQFDKARADELAVLSPDRHVLASSLNRSFVADTRKNSKRRNVHYSANSEVVAAALLPRQLTRRGAPAL